MGLYKLIFLMKMGGLSDEEIAQAIEPNKIVFTPGQFEKEMRGAVLRPIIVWDDIGYWMHHGIPRPSGFSEFWKGIEEYGE